VTADDHSFLLDESRALVRELTSAAGRASIRAEHIALTAAATRAQRIVLTLEQGGAEYAPQTSALA
jgi:hypothetical protein